MASKKTLFVFSVFAVAILLMIYFVFFTPLFVEFNGVEEDEDDWSSYPYVIPGTDMRFPDEEGRYPKEDHYVDGDTWISVGMELDFQGEREDTYLILLYHDEYKDVFLSSPDEILSGRYDEEGDEKILPEGEMDLRFKNHRPELPDDRLKTKEGQAFHYDFLSYFNLQGTDYELDLELKAEKPPATMTDFNGEIRFGEDYYRIHSLTHCRISGTIKIGEDTYQVSGLAWIENQRGSSFGPQYMRWEWFALLDEGGTDFKVVDVVHIEGGHKQYGMFVDRDGEITPIDDITMEVTETKNEFGYSWDISSDDHPISFSITCIDDRMHYTGFAAGVGEARGTLMGMTIDTVAYVELTKIHPSMD